MPKTKEQLQSEIMLADIAVDLAAAKDALTIVKPPNIEATKHWVYNIQAGAENLLAWLDKGDQANAT